MPGARGRDRSRRVNENLFDGSDKVRGRAKPVNFRLHASVPGRQAGWTLGPEGHGHGGGALSPAGTDRNSRSYVSSLPRSPRTTRRTSWQKILSSRRGAKRIAALHELGIHRNRQQATDVYTLVGHSDDFAFRGNAGNAVRDEKRSLLHVKPPKEGVFP